MKNAVLLLGLAGVLASCDAWFPDKTELTSMTAEPVDRPRCDACHGFAPRTGAHRFHLTDSTRISDHYTCRDCHAASIATHKDAVLDSAFTDEQGRWVSNIGWPWMQLDRSKVAYADFAEAVDSVPLMARWREPGAENPEWVTVAAAHAGLPGHANGTIDVVFPARRNLSGEAPASFDATAMTCSSVKCHEPSDHAPGFIYHWKEP
ncbi:MAG: hypothetical protein H6686_03155 [Fibrobacteria bacterium]|nr:hypothetical protein [Fibrobacteria bacterium]